MTVCITAASAMQHIVVAENILFQKKIQPEVERVCVYAFGYEVIFFFLGTERMETCDCECISKA